MFNDVSNQAGGFVEPGRYLLKVVRLEDGTSEQYGAGIKWVMHVATSDTKTLVVNQNGEPYEFFAYSGVSMGPKGKARRWAEAFLGRELQDGERGADVAKAVIGQKAVGLIGNNEQGYPRILQIDPLSALNKARQPVAAAAAPDPASSEAF